MSLLGSWPLADFGLLAFAIALGVNFSWGRSCGWIIVLRGPGDENPRRCIHAEDRMLSNAGG